MKQKLCFTGFVILGCLYLGLLGLMNGCISENANPTSETIQQTTQSGIGELEQTDIIRTSTLVYTAEPVLEATSIPEATTLLTNALSSTPQSVIILTSTTVPTTTPAPNQTLAPPLTSITLNSINEQQTPWTDWVNQFLNVDTDCASYSSDLSLAAFRSDKFRVYDPRSNELIWEYEMPVEPVGGGPIIFSPDSQILAHGGSDQTLHIWDAHTGNLLHEIDFERYIFDVKFTGDGQWIMVNYGVEGGVLAAVNVQSGEIVQFPIFAPVFDTATFTNDSHIGTFLHGEVENREERILTWNPETNGISTLIPLSPDNWVLYEYPDGGKRYYGGRISISPDGNLIALIVEGESERNFQLWSLSEQKWIHTQDSTITRKESIIDFQFSPNSSYFALFSGSALDGVYRVRVWQTSGKFVGEVAEEAGNVVVIQCPYHGESPIHYVNAFTSIGFTPDGLYLATFGYDQDGVKQVVLWSLPPLQ